MEQLRLERRTVFLGDAEQKLYRGLQLETPAIAEERPPQAVSVADSWFEDALGSEWAVAYRLALQESNTRIVVSEIRMLPSRPPREPLTGRWVADVLGVAAPTPAGGIKARTVLRRVRLRAFERELSKILKEYRFPQTFRAPAPPAAGARKRGRKLNELRYAKVAVLYAERYAAGSARPTADVAKRLRLTPATARAAVYKARRLGLLTTTVRGERNGRATPRALAILNTAREGGKKR